MTTKLAEQVNGIYSLMDIDKFDILLKKLRSSPVHFSFHIKMRERGLGCDVIVTQIKSSLEYFIRYIYNLFV